MLNIMQSAVMQIETGSTGGIVSPAPSLGKKDSLNIGFDFPLIASGTIFNNLQWLAIINNEP